MTHVAVIDFGKTNVKLALVAREGLEEVAVRVMPNRVIAEGPFPHFDSEAHWAFICGALRELQAEHGIDAISVTTHGATAALVDSTGALVLPVLDYEAPLPAGIMADYDRLRPDFALSGSPRLEAGLNLGAQLYWLSRAFPAEWARVRHILTWPQYWAFRLSGVAAVEATSLGCHTDLWCPVRQEMSPMVAEMGWSGLIPPLRRAGDILGFVTPGVAEATGLSPDVPVVCGIHDSNASLYPHLLMRQAPFSVVSTGTWVVAMAVGAAPSGLDPDRDVLVNTGADGRPVPSARFMGGREYEIIRAASTAVPEAQDRSAVLAEGLHLLPAVVPGSGPYRGCHAGWTAVPATEGMRLLALAWYLAGMTAECLSMLGAQGEIVVEGPFARNRDYLEMLATATGRVVVAARGGQTGTSQGAALLVAGPLPEAGPEERIAPVPGLAAHARQWHRLVLSHADHAAGPLSALPTGLAS